MADGGELAVLISTDDTMESCLSIV